MTGQAHDPAGRDEPLFEQVLSSLEIAVLEPGPRAGEYRLLGNPPAWWTTHFGLAQSSIFDLAQGGEFLRAYLYGLPSGWKDAGTIERSGPWEEADGQGGTFTLEATTLRVGTRQLVLIERLGARFEQMRDIVQRARERMLAEDHTVKSFRKHETQLTSRLQASERVKDDALALLQHLELAALVLDEQGQITFASDQSLQMLGVSAEQLIGHHWEQALPLLKPDHVRVQEMIARPVGGQQTGSFRLTGSHHRWVEMDIHQDPRHAGRSILVMRDSTEIHDLRRLLDDQATFHDLVGKSPLMRRMYQLVRDVAQVDTTVLIEGETGTGKELVARALHFSSARKQKPFIAANCAGLTDSILTSQLFGHKRGAFTGAIQDQQGLFEAADGGTLFLDEIGDIPAQVQTALLRVLQEKEITRLGEARPRKVDVRVVAATHHNLSEDVVRGTFRADLLYRIRVARIQLPPLRERREDIPLLVDSFLNHICTATRKTVERVHPDTLRVLMTHSWPGNVRELKSAIEFAVISCKGKELVPAELPPEIVIPLRVAPPSTWIPLSGLDERARLLAALSDAQGNRTEAAKRLGVSRATFYRRLVELDIDPQ